MVTTIYKVVDKHYQFLGNFARLELAEELLEQHEGSKIVELQHEEKVSEE